MIPNFSEFRDDIRLPTALAGPVDFWAFSRLALSCLSDMGFFGVLEVGLVGVVSSVSIDIVDVPLRRLPRKRVQLMKLFSLPARIYRRGTIHDVLL